MAAKSTRRSKHTPLMGRILPFQGLAKTYYFVGLKSSILCSVCVQRIALYRCEMFARKRSHLKVPEKFTHTLRRVIVVSYFSQSLKSLTFAVDSTVSPVYDLDCILSRIHMYGFGVLVC